MLQTWTAVGRMVEDGNLRYTQSGKAVCQFRFAVDNGKKPDGEKDTLFATIICWEKLAESVTNFGGKGRMVGVVGRWQQRSYDADDGTKRTVYEVVASTVRFLDKGNAPSMGEGVTPDDSSVPF